MAPTKQQVLEFFRKEMNEDPQSYMDCGEINSTLLAEEAQHHFGVMTEEAQTEIETQIFDWAAEFSIHFPIN
jgi:hypothetical protein